ncbi:MAG: hypothetical protein EOP02_21765 [Proteobacteria bacterium]|nr:MAG: hypothetical protein EOP02_21765 [Pseudomonadota bacterium]
MTGSDHPLQTRRAADTARQVIAGDGCALRLLANTQRYDAAKRQRVTIVFEILAGLPPYGDLPTVIGGGESPVYREGYVIRFDEAETAWVGNFQRGLTDLDFVAALDDLRVLVIAGGSPYLVDPQTRSVEEVGGAFERCHPMPGSTGFLLTDTTDITLLAPSGVVWQSRRLAWDGLRVDAIDSHHVDGHGRHYDDTWHAFRVDVGDGSAIGGAFAGPAH